MPPTLTFACELDPARLTALFADPSAIEDLLALRARDALMLADFSDQRAAAPPTERRRHPGDKHPLLPLEQGCYFTADNTAQAAARYGHGQDWTRRTA